MRFTLDKLDNFQYLYILQDTNKKIKISNSLESIDVVGSTDNSITKQLKTFNSGEYLLKIQDNSFYGCNKLQSVILLHSVNSIGDNAFKDCTNLTYINLDNTPYEYIGNNAFENIGIEQLNFEYYTKTNAVVGKNIFSNCRKLKSASITTNYVPLEIFNNCSALQSILFVLSAVTSDKLTFIDDNALDGIDNVENVCIKGDIADFPLFSNMKNLKTVQLSTTNQFSLIPSFAFSNTPNLTSLTLDDFITTPNQLNINALSNSSITRLELKGISYGLLIAELNTDIIALLDNNFKIKTSTGENGNINTRRTTTQYYRRDTSTISPLLARTMANIGKPFYYGKIYNDVELAIEFSLLNKIPLLIISGKETFLDADSRYVFSHPLFYDWLELQNCIICYAGNYNMFENGKQTKNYKTIITDSGTFDTYAHYYYKDPELRDYTEYGPFSEFSRPGIKDKGSVWSCGYAGDPVYLMPWDASTLVATFGKDDVKTPKNIYKIFTNRNIVQQYPSYDLSTDTFSTYTIKSQNELRRVLLFSLYPGERHSTYCGSAFTNNLAEKIEPVEEWPIFTLGILLNPSDSTKIERSTYSKHLYMHNKDNTGGRYYKNESGPRQKNAKTFKELYGNTNIIDIIDDNSYTILFYGNHNTSVCKPYKLMVGDKTLEEYFEKIPKKIVGGTDEYGNEYYVDNPEYKKNEWLAKKATEFNAGKHGGYSCHFDHGVKNSLKWFDYHIGSKLKNHTRNPSFNAPDYVKKEIDLSYVDDTKEKFNCWGIGHDCVVITSDGKQHKWNYSKQRFI